MGVRSYGGNKQKQVAGKIAGGVYDGDKDKEKWK